MPQQKTPKKAAADLIEEWLKRSSLQKQQVAARANFNDYEEFRRGYLDQSRNLNTDAERAIAVVRAFVERLTDKERCRASEAIHFFILTCLPLDRFEEVRSLKLFPDDEWQQALAVYLPFLQRIAVGSELTPSEVAELERIPSKAQYQLATPTPDFTGRQEEIDKLIGALSSAIDEGAVAAIRSLDGSVVGGVRGMGGVGKTQLALVVGYRLRSRFPLQIPVDLQGTREQPLSVEAALQTVLRVFRPDEQLPESTQQLHILYQSDLLKQPALIFADDAFDAAQLVALRPPLGSALLVTSRFDIEATDFEMTVLDLAVLPKEDAVELLQKINAGLSKEVAEALAELCGRLPLALRVSAVVTKRGGREPEEWVALLRDERQRLSRMVDRRTNLDVEASLRLSYVQFEASEQQTLAQLGVMNSSFDRSGAKAIVVLDDEIDVVDCLDRLEEANLLDRDDEGRYALHELVRVFALARLREGGDDAERAARLRHARYYIIIAKQAEQLFLQGGENIAGGLALFDRERQQLDAARAWLQAQPVADEVDALLIADADATVHIGDLRYPKLAVSSTGQHSGCIPQLERALRAAQRLGLRSAQGAVLGGLGNAYAALGDARRSISFYEQHLTIAREFGDRRGEGHALGNLGAAYAALGDARRSISFYEQHLTIAREFGDRRGEGHTLGGLGNAYAALGDARRAISFYEQHLTIAREFGDRRGEGHALGNLGVAYAELGDARRAISFYEQVLTIMRELGDRRGEGDVLVNLGIAYKDLGDARRAISFYEQVLTIMRELGDRRGEGDVLGNLGVAYEALGDVRRAISFYEQVLTITHEFGDRQGEAQTRWNYGRLLVLEGDSEHGLALMRACLHFEQAIGHPRAAEHAMVIERLQQGAALDESLPSLQQTLDNLSETVQQALRQGDGAALKAALEALPAEEATAIIERLERAGIIGTQRGPDMAQVLREYEPLLRGIAAVAVGDETLRAAIEEALPRLEEDGWRLAEAIWRIWAGERDEAALTEGIDANSAQLIARVLELIATPENDESPDSLPESVQEALQQYDMMSLEQALAALPEDERARALNTLQARQQRAVEQIAQLDPEQLIASLPETIQQALLSQDQAAFDAALAALAPEQQQAVAQTLVLLQARAAFDSQQEAASQPAASQGPDIPRALQEFAPLLGNIALAVFGDEVARALAEEELPRQEQRGWKLQEPAQRIWAGERNADLLTGGLDAVDTALVRRVLDLIALGKDFIMAASSQQLANIRQQSELAAVQALRGNDLQERAALVQRFEELAQQAEGAAQSERSPWLALASDLRALAGRLTGSDKE